MLKIACRLLALVVIAGTAACDRDPGPIPPPSSDAVQTVQASIRLAREGDIAGLLELSLPPAEFTRMKTEWDQRRVIISLTEAGQQLKAQASLIPECMLRATRCALPEIQSITRQIQALRERLTLRP